ncbi:DNA/RNA non-specific endonuclease, partial [Neoconidiobolus thromboides FSU 785]
FKGPISDPIRREAYIGSYNRQLRNPNFVIEELTEANLINKSGADRGNSKFKEDDNIPKLFRSLLKDYSKSGYDRGHMVPAADVKYSQSAMDETFYLTNMAPQVGVGFNRHYWAYLEEFCRGLTKQFDKVYVITGPLYLPKKGDGFPDKEKWYVQYEVIGNPPNIAVPTHFFKVLLTVPKGGGAPYLGAFLLPNAKIPEEVPLERFSTSIESIEKASGLIFFDKLGPNKETENSKLCDKITCKLNSKFIEKVKSYQQ